MRKSMGNYTKKLICIAVALALVLSLAPLSGLAEESAPVTTMDALAEDAKSISVAYGAAQEDIAFPALTADGAVIEGVTWACAAGYDGRVAGTYIFSPQLPADLDIAEGSALPDVAVTVLPQQAESTPAAAQEEIVSMTEKTVIASFTLSGPTDIMVGAGTEEAKIPFPTVNANEPPVEITDIEWKCTLPATGYDKDAPGEYTFTAVPGENAYTLAEGAAAPGVTVVVNEEMLMSPMASADFTTATPFANIKAAIEGASAGDAFTFAAGTYAFTDVINIPASVTISGAGQASTILTVPDGNAGGFRHFTLADNTTVEIAEITLQGPWNGTANPGEAGGGKAGVANGGIYTMSGNSNNVTTILTLTNTTISGCINDSPYSQDLARFPSFGGGVAVLGSVYSTLNMEGCTLDTNYAVNNDGGGAFSDGPTNINNCTFSNNTASGSGGGVVLGWKPSSLRNSTLAGNTSLNGSGGGAYTFAREALVTNNTITDNTAANSGGGVYSFAQDITFSNNTVADNHAGNNGGGYNGLTTLLFENNTITGNSALGRGGGVYSNSYIMMKSNTITGNTAPSGSGIDVNTYGGSTDNVIFGNIIAGNGAGTNFYQNDVIEPDVGLTTDGSYNIIGYAGAVTQASLFGGAPTPADNGGDTKTIMPAPGSAAVDAVPASESWISATDQRGQARPNGTNADIGAVEVKQPTGFDISPASATIAEGDSRQLSAVNILPAGGYDAASASWSSSDAAVLAVDASGNISAVSPGTATITAKVWNTTQTLTLRVLPLHAQTPSITAQPQAVTCFVGDSLAALTVRATVTDGGTLSYQWHKNTQNSNTGGSAIPGATRESYTPPADAAALGTTYYYCVVTNTNNEAVTTKAAMQSSNAAAVTVRPVHTITATAGEGGSITPSGATPVKDRAGQAFTIAPNTGYVVADVVVDGQSAGAVSSYTFDNVTADHTISATFRASSITVTDRPDANKPLDLRQDAVFTFSGEYSMLVAVRLNDHTLSLAEAGNARKDLSGYPGYGATLGNVKKGSTVVTLYKEFLQWLPDGNHTLEVEFADGNGGTALGSLAFGIKRDGASATTVADSGVSPRTGDGANIGFWIALCVAAGVLIMGCVAYRKRNAHLKQKS